MGKPYFLCKKFLKKRESYQVRLDFFGSTFGVWWGLFFATWRGRALGGNRGPPRVGLRWVSGFKNRLLPSSKINISLENTGCFINGRRKKKKFKNKKERKTSGPIPKKALIFLSRDFCFQNKLEKKKKFGHLYYVEIKAIKLSQPNLT